MDLSVPNEGLNLESKKLTPLMQQYWEIKSVHEDKVLLFRMGDFFEMFYRDAEIAAPILGIALTSRNKKAADETPMCGVPHHSIGGPINKLLSAGFKVAICDQIEDPKFAKGIVKRAVTRIMSPGIVYDPDTLEAANCNYLAAFDKTSVSFLETTTGEAFFYQLPEGEIRRRLFATLNPVEIVLSTEQKDKLENTEEKPSDLSESSSSLMSVFDISEKHSKQASLPESAHRLIGYARYMQGESAANLIPEFEARELAHRLELTPTVLRHLEVFANTRGDVQGSLFQAIDRCRTSAGTRLFRRWLQFPLANKNAIEERLERVGQWSADAVGLKEVRRTLAGMGDVERRLGKIANPGCNPRDLMALAESLQAGIEATSQAKRMMWPERELSAAAGLIRKIHSTLVEEPPLQTKNGHFIRKGVDPALDELIDLSQNSNQKILELEARERELSGIGSLKVRFNNVFGYYIEITNTHRDKVPARYQRKQTLANAERYLTPELEELEHKVLSAQGKRLELEVEIFDRLKRSALEVTPGLLRLARLWSELDVTTALAWLALEQNYVRPSFDESGALHIEGSRHPVVEQSLSTPFVSNDLHLAAHNGLLLTGPNMAGKSTLMRQVALTAIMAQAGSFVPARLARLPIFDRIFTRIGASDFLAEGLSTFMVEMKETAEMLKSATDRSLVILDEVGRGTSTFDGMSLARAILEYLLENSRAMTLFATHYHELTALSERYPQLHNAHMAIHERAGEISFLHALLKGPANKSYGIHVARLAGLPGSVTKRAALILKDLESARNSLRLLEDFSPQLSLGADVESGNDPDDVPVAALKPEEEQVLEQLRALQVDGLTPLGALNRLAEIKNLLQ